MWKMVYASCSYLLLAFAVYVFLKLVTSCVWLPTYLKSTNGDMIKRNQRKNDINTGDEVNDEVEDKKNV